MTFSCKSIASWTLLLLMLMQFIPLKRINPPAVSTIQAPEIVKKALKKSCYDCHSNETRWTSIAWIAPVSWLASSIVASGRSALNFSAWNNKKRSEIRKVISEGSVHQRLYYLWKPQAQLTTAETSTLLEWLNVN
jgi:hypothetical protein